MAERKIAVVTGSSSGIGLLTTIEFAANGYTVVATMRDLARSGRLEEAAQKAGVRDRLDLRRLDVTEFETLPGVVEQIVRDHGRIDVLVNNAGMSVAGFVEDLSVDEIRDAIRDELLWRGRHVEGRAANHASADVRAHHPGELGGRTGRLPDTGGLQRLEVGAGGDQRSRCASRPNRSGFASSWSSRARMTPTSGRATSSSPKPGWTTTRPTKSAAAVSPSSSRAGRKDRGDARDVARLILRIANNPNPKLRYLIGKGTERTGLDAAAGAVAPLRAADREGREDQIQTRHGLTASRTVYRRRLCVSPSSV